MRIPCKVTYLGGPADGRVEMLPSRPQHDTMLVRTCGPIRFTDASIVVPQQEHQYRLRPTGWHMVGGQMEPIEFVALHKGAREVELA